MWLKLFIAVVLTWLNFWLLPSPLNAIFFGVALWFAAHLFPIRYPSRERVVKQSRNGLAVWPTLLIWLGLVLVTCALLVWVTGKPTN
ncbi:hypothetical protein [Alteromonas halophila]|uniref:Transmembrane protein n=1 Tax=Alteromonas halophila TaxID=516698 RepID=A0A918JJE7_9ALTE|nr:hypothetical protein [Alteromonas halophila]GGW83126.1 hypothetical protein GCM10007391_15540 [Alteromonas halophila]